MIVSTVAAGTASSVRRTGAAGCPLLLGQLLKQPVPDGGRSLVVVSFAVPVAAGAIGPATVVRSMIALAAVAMMMARSVSLRDKQDNSKSEKKLDNHRVTHLSTPKFCRATKENTAKHALSTYR
jgi:hypothetical protein